MMKKTNNQNDPMVRMIAHVLALNASKPEDQKRKIVTDLLDASVGKLPEMLSKPHQTSEVTAAYVDDGFVDSLIRRIAVKVG